MKMLSTNNSTPREKIPPDVRPADRGPMTMGDRREEGVIAFCVQFGTREEWSLFAQTIRTRKETEPRTVWMKCSKCGTIAELSYRWKMKIREEGAPCSSCNPTRDAARGRMLKMKPAEIEAYLSAKKILSAEALERTKKAAFAARNAERVRAGLDPITREQYDAQEKAKWDEARRRDASFGRTK